MTWDEAEASLSNYRENLRKAELKESTVKKYLKDISSFLEAGDGKVSIEKSCVIRYKKKMEEKYRPSSVNSYLVSINRFFKWSGHQELTVKTERLQKRCSLNHVLESEDYRKLLSYADREGKEKYYYIMRTLAGTGIRIGELKYITCEAVRNRIVVINHKGKIREICIPNGLGSVLTEYCSRHGINDGIIFHGRIKDKPMDASGIWKSMKRMAEAAGVDPLKVYPHSFRHLFAKTYMRQIGNIAELSDILGHSNIETTRIYTMGTMAEKMASLEQLNL